MKCLLVADKCLTRATHASSVDVGKAEEKSQSGTSTECGIPPASPLPVHLAHLSCTTLSPLQSTVTSFFSKEAELRGEPLRVLHVPVVRTTLGSKHSNVFIAV